MGDRVVDVAPRQDEVPMIEGDVVKAMSVLRAQGYSVRHPHSDDAAALLAGDRALWWAPRPT